MWDQIQKIVEKELDIRHQNLLDENQHLQEYVDKLSKQNTELQIENHELKTKLDQINKFNNVHKLFNYESLEKMIEGLGFDKIKIDLNGMYSDEKVPKIFKLICKYYHNRTEILDIMDTFNQSYPEWYRTFKLPFDYNKEELIKIMKYNKFTMTNSCYFEGYIGFYYEWMKVHHGNLDSQLNNKTTYSSDLYIPFDLLLRNPLWLEDDMFDLLLEKIKPYGKEEFYYICQYQKLSNEQQIKLGKKLTNRTYKDYVSVVFNNCPAVKESPEIVSNFSDRINDNSYSVFYFARFPEKYQIEYIKKNIKELESSWSSDIWRILEKSTISKKNKDDLALAIINCEKEIK